MKRTEICVIHPNRRWEVAIDGVTEPLADSFSSFDRAVGHARANARMLDVDMIRIERWDGLIEGWVAVDRDRVNFSQVA